MSKLKRTTISLAGEVLARTEAERDRLAASSKLEVSLSETVALLVREALDARDAARSKKWAKS